MSAIHLERLPRTVELVREGSAISFRYVDQRLLPDTLEIKQTEDWREVKAAIASLAVRGAPAIGLAGAAAFVLWFAQESARRGESEGSVSEADMRQAAHDISQTRPTAINLAWALDKLLDAGLSQISLSQTGKSVEALFDLVKSMEVEDEAINRAIGQAGAQLLKNNSQVLTHCNAGSLATAFYGTALGVIYAAAEQDKIERVYVDETRPVGQGVRLSAWELSRVGISTTVLCDNMAASLMAQKRIDAIFVGADRIAANGDVANKIGTYSLAVVAHAHQVPFYVAAPLSSFDIAIKEGSSIPIEERDAAEVVPRQLEGVDVMNPAFDVTPARLISGIITQKGVIAPDKVRQLFESET